MHILLVIVAILAVAPASAATATDGGRYLDYLYMEPNEGGSSAGHVAIAFDDRTYAYQRSGDGRLLLERNATEHVRWLYAVLGNRAVNRARVAVSADTFERLREGFNRRWLVQQRQLVLRDRLASARHLLRLFAAGAPHPADGIPIEGAGYFSADGASPALRRLAADVTAAHGAGFVARRRDELRAARARLTPTMSPPAPPLLTRDRYPAGGDDFAARYLATTSGITALETLQRAPGLDPASIMIVDDAPLDAAERAALARWSDRLRAELVRLAASERPDFGYPLLVGMARLTAVERSLASDRLVVLDAFPAAGRRVSHAALARTIDAARALRDDACDELAERRRRFAALVTPTERDAGRLENAANRCVELARGLAAGRDVRIASETLVPARTALRPVDATPEARPAAFAAAARAADDAARTHERALDELYRYDLVRRNCVTEAFDTIDAILGPDAAAALGGTTATGGARIVPSLASRAVRRRWRVVASDTTPSYRRAKVAALARTGAPLAVRLRESNVLTSTVYRPSRDDSTFLFFTDDAPVLRPLLGAANLGVGVGASLVGLARAPFDRGAALEAGLRGVLWSVPELVFVNVRKGSYDHVPKESYDHLARRDPPTAPPWRESPPPSPR